MVGETVLTIVGNLTDDPSLRYTPNGFAVANFTIAATARTFDKQRNEWVDGDPLFLRCSVWREHAENIASSLSKGQRVIAQGNLKQRNWENDQGEKRSGFELDVQEIGPALRYATAQVTRKNSSSSQQPPTSQQQGQSWQAQQPPADSWAQGGEFDEAPF